jgi:hypothetical protein
MKIRPMEAELFHADRTKLIVAFHNFANAPKTYCTAVSFPGLWFEIYTTKKLLATVT